MNPEHTPQDIHASILLSDHEMLNTKRAPKHIDHVFDMDIACHTTSAPSWAVAKQHKLQTSVRHSSDPSYLNFLNITRHRPPTETEIKDTFSTSFIDKDMLSHYLNPTTMILCSQRENVTTYNDCIFKTIFAPKYIIFVTLDTNATEAHNIIGMVERFKV